MCSRCLPNTVLPKKVSKMYRLMSQNSWCSETIDQIYQIKKNPSLPFTKYVIVKFSLTRHKTSFLEYDTPVSPVSKIAALQLARFLLIFIFQVPALFFWICKCSNLNFLAQLFSYFGHCECIGPMHEEKILGSTPNNTNCLVLVSFFKVSCQHGSNGIWTVEKYWFSRGEFSIFKSETKTRQVVFWGVSPQKCLHA